MIRYSIDSIVSPVEEVSSLSIKKDVDYSLEELSSGSCHSGLCGIPSRHSDYITT